MEMETFIAVIAVILGIIGIIGSVVPGIPGPPLSWIGMLLLYFWGGTNGAGEPMSITLLMVMLAVTVIVTILDYIIPIKFNKVTGGGKAGSWGSVIGMIVGLFVPPIGIILGALLGAFIGEFVFAKQTAGTSVKSAVGTFLGFLCGTGMKLICCGVMMYYIIVYI